MYKAIIPKLMHNLVEADSTAHRNLKIRTHHHTDMSSSCLIQNDNLNLYHIIKSVLKKTLLIIFYSMYVDRYDNGCWHNFIYYAVIFANKLLSFNSLKLIKITLNVINIVY